MKLKNFTLQHLLLITGMLFCFSCSEDTPAAIKAETPKAFKNPFKFYKDIEVKPGLNFEVLSWVREKIPLVVTRFLCLIQLKTIINLRRWNVMESLPMPGTWIWITMVTLKYIFNC